MFLYVNLLLYHKRFTSAVNSLRIENCIIGWGFIGEIDIAQDIQMCKKFQDCLQWSTTESDENKCKGHLHMSECRMKFKIWSSLQCLMEVCMEGDWWVFDGRLKSLGWMPEGSAAEAKESALEDRRRYPRWRQKPESLWRNRSRSSFSLYIIQVLSCSRVGLLHLSVWNSWANLVNLLTKILKLTQSSIPRI